MNDLFSKLIYEMEKKRDTVLVSVIAEEGSAPRGVGAQMLVGLDGRLLGTIGGGPSEYRATELAAGVLRDKMSVRHEYVLTPNPGEDIGAVCGGSVSVWFQYIAGDDPAWAELAGLLLQRITDHRGGWLVQRLDGGAPSLLDENGALLCGPAVPEASALNQAPCRLTENAFFMALPVGERAVIFGAGHCSLALAPILRSVGFRPVIFDDRAEYADAALFPSAERVICGDFTRIADDLTLTPEDYVVVMTSGHTHDYEVQEQALRAPLAYIGVIGSRKKTASVNARLRAAGVSEEAIHSVHTPIGTSIKAVTPEEIAISIAGEMIYERALRREGGVPEEHSCPMH